MIHSLVSGSEIISLFSKQEIEDLIDHWELRKKFLGFNNHILYHIISKRIYSHLKIILSTEFITSSSFNSPFETKLY